MANAISQVTIFKKITFIGLIWFTSTILIRNMCIMFHQDSFKIVIQFKISKVRRKDSQTDRQVVERTSLLGLTWAVGVLSKI